MEGIPELPRPDQEENDGGHWASRWHIGATSAVALRFVALSLLYEQGTRSFSGRFTSGVSQSFTAKSRLAAVSPQLCTSILWLGICNLLLCLLGYRWLSWDIAASAKDRIP